MSLDKVNAGKNIPHEFNVIIEIPCGSNIKYEIKDGVVFVDRFVPMHYPCNYGYIPNTLADDGDPIDILVIGDFSLIPGSVITCRPLGVLLMEDESGKDEKIIAVPISKLNREFDALNSYKDLSTYQLEKIKHFFEHYKDLEKDKWVKVTDWHGIDKAIELIEIAVKNK